MMFFLYITIVYRKLNYYLKSEKTHTHITRPFPGKETWYLAFSFKEKEGEYQLYQLLINVYA